MSKDVIDWFKKFNVTQVGQESNEDHVPAGSQVKVAPSTAGYDTEKAPSTPPRGLSPFSLRGGSEGSDVIRFTDLYDAEMAPIEHEAQGTVNTSQAEVSSIRTPDDSVQPDSDLPSYYKATKESWNPDQVQAQALAFLDHSKGPTWTDRSVTTTLGTLEAPDTMAAGENAIESDDE